MAHGIPHPTTGGRWYIEHIELMHLLEGSASFEDATGSVTFGRGDIFLAARGAECAWISEVHVKKVYAIHRPV